MKIGINQIIKGTPAVVRHIRSVIVYTIAGSLPFATILARKFGIAVEDYAMYAGFAMLLAKSVSMLFGVTDEEEVKVAKSVIKEKIDDAKGTLDAAEGEDDLVGPRPDDRKP